MNRRIALTAVATLGLLAVHAAPAAAADTWSIDTVHSELTFRIRHFVSKTSGRFNQFEGTVVTDAAKPTAGSVDFKIKTASIDTGNEKRDGHLKSADFFDAEKYPEITFKSTRVEPAGKDAYKVTGNFSMHGVTREITLPVSFLGETKDPWGGTRAGFGLTTTLNRKDYNITWNKAMDAGGVMLGEDVEVTINLELKKEAPAAATATAGTAAAPAADKK